MKNQNTITMLQELLNGGRNLCHCNVIFISNRFFCLALKNEYVILDILFLSYLFTIIQQSSRYKLEARCAYEEF